MNITIKLCPKCNTPFTLKDILESKDIVPIGMASDNDEPELNFFYFNHITPVCNTTFTIPLYEFESIINEYIPETVLKGSDYCEGHCSTIDDLLLCGQDCHHAPYRRLLLSMIEKKNSSVLSKAFNC